VLSGLIIAYGISVEGVTVTVPLILLYTVLVLLMTLLWYDMEVILRTIPFFVISANGIMELESHLIELNFKVPGVLYKGAWRAVFYFVLPYGIMSTVPTQLISGMLGARALAQALCVAAAFTWFALWFWRFGLRRYKSAGG
jgi:ABC-2 type transport system permease protein